jgi:hypothetical protein
MSKVRKAKFIDSKVHEFLDFCAQAGELESWIIGRQTARCHGANVDNQPVMGARQQGRSECTFSV